MNEEAEHADRPGTGVGPQRVSWILEEILAVVAGVILFLAGIAAILRSDMGDALSTIPSGLAFLGVAVWARRSAPARIAANRKRREAIIGTPQLWTDAELWSLRTSADVDELHRVVERATDRRTDEAERWFLSHFFTHGPDWVVSINGGEPTPLAIPRYRELAERIPPKGMLQITEHALVVEVFAQPAWRRAASRKRRHSPEAVWELRPAHCRCAMPGWRTDDPAPAPQGYL
ncbi:MAG TPA: hypothetical protein VGR26_11200 [Acidimicrobiales bacterium]|nr:hypothetical protein [Acidimicrobiales bacterium]